MEMHLWQLYYRRMIRGLLLGLFLLLYLPAAEGELSVDLPGYVLKLPASVKTSDQRTPLGVYFITEELDTRLLHEKYGPVAFPLDYPNVWDTANQRTGSGIWIHGVEIDLLRDKLLAVLDIWSSSYRDGDWNRFLSLYSRDFAYRGMNREEWSAYRVQTVGARLIDDFTVDDILLLADPEEDGLYLSRFQQVITESGRPVVTTKRLYWRKSPHGDLLIVAEDNG